MSDFDEVDDFGGAFVVWLLSLEMSLMSLGGCICVPWRYERLKVML